MANVGVETKDSLETPRHVPYSLVGVKPEIVSGVTTSPNPNVEEEVTADAFRASDLRSLVRFLYSGLLFCI